VQNSLNNISSESDSVNSFPIQKFSITAKFGKRKKSTFNKEWSKTFYTTSLKGHKVSSVSREIETELQQLKLLNHQLIERNEILQTQLDTENQYKSLYLSIINQSLTKDSKTSNTLNGILQNLEHIEEEMNAGVIKNKINTYESMIQSMS